MKVFIILSLFLVATQAMPGRLTINSELNEEWEIFKTKYNKKYEPLTEAARRIIWEENLNFIRQHNLEYDLGKHTYTLGLNEYSDLTNDEFKAKLLGKKMNKSKSKGSEFMVPENMGALPSSVDWRTKGYVTPIKHQLHCKSCWAFSATGALEGQHFRKTGKLVSLSEQQLVDCSRSFHNYGCEGGFTEMAFDYVKDHGMESEDDYRYYAKDMPCLYNKSKVVANFSSYAHIKQGNETDLAYAVTTIGPVSVAIDANGANFQNYKNGIYNNPECSSVNLDHAVLVVGYGSLRGDNYWIVKNSWGENWGDGGYILMSKDKNNQCGIVTDATYPVV